MNIEDWTAGVQYMMHSGFYITYEMFVMLRTSLLVLKKDNQFENVFFWGVIMGQVRDYHIAFGYRKDVLKHRTYYYSTNKLDWFLLPKPKQDNYYPTAISVIGFEGDPSYKLKVVDDSPVGLDWTSTTKETKPPPEPCIEPEPNPKAKVDSGSKTSSHSGRKSSADIEQKSEEEKYESYKEEGVYILKEEDRLACTVRRISQEAFIVPRGALLKKMNGRVIPNEMYKGVSEDQITEAINYFHFRIPLNTWEENLEYRKDYNYAFDFMDPIHKDIPKGRCWVLDIVEGQSLVVLKNLYWQGLTFYQRIGKREHGCAYFGNGIKNLNVPFNIY